MYEGDVDLDIIRDVKRAVTIPVIANGDVFTGVAAVRTLKYTGADLVMIGRGAFGNPWLFRECVAAIDGEEIPPRPTVREIADTASAQFEISARLNGERGACLDFRRHYAWYLKGIPYARRCRELIAKLETAEDFHKVTEVIKRELG
jgi:tRNA-dihydrouridine synthase B